MKDLLELEDGFDSCLPGLRSQSSFVSAFPFQGFSPAVGPLVVGQRYSAATVVDSAVCSAKLKSRPNTNLKRAAPPFYVSAARYLSLFLFSNRTALTFVCVLGFSRFSCVHAGVYRNKWVVGRLADDSVFENV